MAKDKVLLVEGNDDLHVISALCEQHNIPETFNIIDCKGIGELIDSVPIRLKESNLKTIGIIVDADSDLNKRWQSLKTVLTNAGYSLPTVIPSAGLVVRDGNKITIGVWLMPDNNANGMLEDFIKFLVPSGDKLMPIVESTLNNIETQGLNKYKTIHKTKAVIHTWLAFQENPGTPMGLSITRNYLTTNTPQCAIFVSWLKELFKD